MHTPPPLPDIPQSTNPNLRPPPLPPEVGDSAEELIIPAELIATVIEPHVAQIAILAQVLLGAAHSDGFYAASEAVTIAQILAKFVDIEPLPEPVRLAMRGFDPQHFDVEEACAQLAVETARDRRELLDLISRVTDADQQLQAGEGAYLRRVGRAIGAAPDEYADLLTGEAPPPLPPPLRGDFERFDEANPPKEEDDE